MILQPQFVMPGASGPGEPELNENQGFIDFSDWPEGVNYPPEHVGGSFTNGVCRAEALSEALGGKVLFVSREGGGGSREFYFLAVSGLGDDISSGRRVIYKVRRHAGVDPIRLFARAFNRGATLSDALVAARSNFAESSVSHAFDTFDWLLLEIHLYDQSSIGNIEVRLWEADGTPRPEAPTVGYETDSFGSVTGEIGVEVDSAHVNQWQIDWVSWGINGEQAPIL